MIWRSNQNRENIPVLGQDNDESTGVIMFKVLEER